MEHDAPTTAMTTELAKLHGLDKLRSLRSLAATVDTLTASSVTDLRSTGVTWEAIGEALGVARQAAQRKYRNAGRSWTLYRNAAQQPSTQWQQVDTGPVDESGGDDDTGELILEILDVGKYQPGEYRLTTSNGAGTVVASAEAEVNGAGIALR